MTTDMVECYFCGERKHIDTAIHDGWEPMFWESEHQHVDEPTCPLCAVKFLATDPESGELVRKPIATIN